MRPERPERVRKTAKKTWARRPAPRIELHPSFVPVVDAFARYPDVSQRRMFSSSSILAVNGKIFAMLVKGKFVAKLPKQRVRRPGE
jgi:hypothetical protein